MAKRKLLKVQDRQALFDIPTDEDSLMRHYSLSPADRLEIEVRRREHNRLGFAVQLCLMRYPGRALMANEILPEVKPKHTLAPGLPLDRMDQFDMWRDAFERRIHIAMLEIQQQILPPVGLARLRRIPPDRLFQRRPIVDRKPRLEQDEAPGILQHLQAKPLFVELPRPANVANERDRIDKTHCGHDPIGSTQAPATG